MGTDGMGLGRAGSGGRGPEVGLPSRRGEASCLQDCFSVKGAEAEAFSDW